MQEMQKRSQTEVNSEQLTVNTEQPLPDYDSLQFVRKGGTTRLKKLLTVNCSLLTIPYPGILEIYFSICLIWSTICAVVGFSAFALRKKSLAARNSRLFIIRLHIWR